MPVLQYYVEIMSQLQNYEHALNNKMTVVYDYVIKICQFLPIIQTSCPRKYTFYGAFTLVKINRGC